jgi:hypothetical protein
MPVEGQVDDKQGSEREGDDADSGEGVAKMAPVAGPEIKYTAGNEGKRDGIGSSHPLAMLDDLAVTRGYEGGGGADDPGSSLHAYEQSAILYGHEIPATLAAGRAGSLSLWMSSDEARRIDCEYALANCIAFGTKNTALVLRKI